MNQPITAVVVTEFNAQLAKRKHEFADALQPFGTSADPFLQAAKTAVAHNPALLNADRRTLFNALRKCATDGLRPDGRQAVLKIYNTKRGPVVGYEQMIGSVRYLVQQSGEITRFEQTIVYEADKFLYEAGDRPSILHVPTLNDRGRPILVYSIAQYRDGTLSREVMTFNEIEQTRARSSNKDGDAWRLWWGEMARKTVAKRHAKILPTSPAAADALRRGDAADEFMPPLLPAADDSSTRPPGRPRLAQQFDALVAPPRAEPESPRARGRPRSRKAAEAATEAAQADSGQPDDTPPPDDQAFNELPPEDFAQDTGEAAAAAGDAGMFDDQVPDSNPDFERGRLDRAAGRSGCLDKTIRDNPARLKHWQRGFDLVVDQRS